jgi:predicted DNA-binding protein
VKKVAGKAKQIKAVMNVKTGKYKTHKTHKEIKTYLEEMTDMGVAENLKSFMFDSQEHLQQVSAAYKNNDDPPTHTPIFTSTASRPLAASVPVSPNPH